MALFRRKPEIVPVAPAGLTAASSAWVRPGGSTRVLRASERQTKALHYARHVIPVARSASNFGSQMASVMWRPGIITATGEIVASDDPMGGTYAASLNSDRDWCNRLARQLHNTAEGWLTVERDPDTQSLTWQGRSIRELVDQGKGKRMELRTSAGMPAVPMPPGMDAVRVWLPDDDYPDDAWSPLMSDQALAVMGNILALEALIQASHQSLLNGGILKVPVEMFAAIRPLLQVTQTDGTIVPVSDNDIIARFLSYFEDAGQQSNLTPLERLVPLLAIAPGDTLSGLDHVHMQPRISASDAQAMKEPDLKTIAMMLPTPEISLLGLGASNHWNGALEKAAAAQIYWNPSALVIAQAITRSHYRPWLRELKRLGLWSGEPHRMVIYADTSDLTQDPGDYQKDLAFFSAGVISPKSLRARNGYSEDESADAGNEKPVQVTAVDPGVVAPPAGATLSQPAPPLTAAARPEQAETRRLVDDITSRLTVVDTRAHSRLTTVTELALSAALREAGFKVRKAADKTQPNRSRVASAGAQSDVLNVWLIRPQDVNGTPTAFCAAVGAIADVDTAIADEIDRYIPQVETILTDADDEMWAAVGLTGNAAKSRNSTVESTKQAISAAVALWVSNTVSVARRFARRTTIEDTVTVPKVAAAEMRAVTAVALGRSWTVSPLGVLTPTVASSSYVTAPAVQSALVDYVQDRVRVFDGLVTSIVAEHQWIHTTTTNPFQPHVDQVSAGWTTDDSFGGNYPGDHAHCRCRIETRYRLITAG
jgi:hypothetical protein